MKKFFISASIALFTLGAANAQTWEIGSPTASDVTATLSGGTLTVSGTGAMQNFNYARTSSATTTIPWYSVRTQIISLVVEEGITSIGDDAFYGFSDLTGTFTIPASLASIGNEAFFGCPFTDIVNNSPSFKLASAASVGAAKVLLPASQTGDDFVYADMGGGSSVVGCLGVGVLTIPAGATYIGGVFRGCTFTDIVNNSPRFKFASAASVGAAKVLLSVLHPSDDFDYNADRPEGFLAVGELTVPEYVTSWHTSNTSTNGWFAYCTGLTAVHFNAIYCTNIYSTTGSQGIFYNCTGIKTITIGEKVTKIPDYLFGGCTEVTTVNYNAANAAIAIQGGYPTTTTVFRDCPRITTLNIGENVKSFPDYIFSGRSGITGTLTLPAGVTSIGRNAFTNCSGLTGALTLPDGLASISSGAFGGCSGLTGTLTIPDGLTVIDGGAFSGCSGFTGALTIPEGVKFLGTNAFGGCSGITTVNFNAENCATSSNTVYSPFPDSFSTLNIGENVRAIPRSAFTYCSGITTLTIPNSVTVIGDMAFTNCTGLRGTLTIPASVTVIGNNAFARCSGIEGVLISPNSVTSISGMAFNNCSGIKTLTLPAGVTSILQNAFTSCPALSDIYNPQSTPLVIFNTFSGMNKSTCTLHIPTGSLAAYQAAAVWQDFILEEMDFPVFVTGISLSHSSQTLAEGQTQQLAAVITPANAANKSVSWKSSNESIATVSAAGLVTAVSKGTASITATTEDGGYTATCAVTVIRAATGVALNKTAALLHTGEAEQLTATVQPDGATNQNVTWESYSPSVATVDATGKITAVSAGAATIAAITEDGGYYALCTVTVTAFDSVTLSITLAAGQQLQMAAAVSPAVGPYDLQPVTWQSSNTGIATVSSEGLVKAVSEGAVLISATTVDGACTASCLITVTAADPTGTRSGSRAYSELTIYPNPADDYLQFAMNDVEIRSVEILDAAGRTVGARFIAPANNGVQTIPVAHLPSGVYLLKIDTDKGVQTARFVKK